MYCAVLGPYNMGYTSNGRYMLLGGRKGHLAMMDMLHMDLIKEFEVSSFTIEAFNLHTGLLHLPLFMPGSNSITLELFFL